MKFTEVVGNIGTITDLRRFASAHVIDHTNLKEKELREAVLKVKPQYYHFDTVKEKLECAFYVEQDLTPRVLSKLIINTLLEEVGFALPSEVLEERVIQLEQKIIDISNEKDIVDLAGSSKTKHFSDLELYYFVLKVAWEHRDTKSPDEANLLRRLRNKLYITDYEHRILETKLGKFPKANNELHTRAEISRICRYLQYQGLVAEIRDAKRKPFNIIPDEIVGVIRKVLGIEIRTDGYRLLLKRKEYRKKPVLHKALALSGYEIVPYDKIDELIEKIIRRAKVTDVLYLLSNEQLHGICSELEINVSGTKADRIGRIIEYYDKLKPVGPIKGDVREKYYKNFLDLAYRNRSKLRAKQLIEKDLEIEHYFELATEYLYEKMLNHKPLVQPGVNRPDGLISFKDMYLMWDNKSKEEPGLVNLKDHIKQFNGYMENSDKPVPIFLVIAPDFTPESELLAIQYSAENIKRNIVLIKAEELLEVAEKWHSPKNKRHDEPFPLGLFGNSGRFNKKAISKLI